MKKTQKKTSNNIIDLTLVNKIYNKLYKKYSELSKSQKQKLRDDLDKIDYQDGDYNKISTFINFCVERNHKNVSESIKKNMKNVAYHKTSKKSSCFKDYKVGEKLGSGMYGDVFHASKNNKEYAIKVQTLNELVNDNSITTFKKLNKEIEISKKMGELGIGPKIFDVYYCNDSDLFKLYIIMQNMNEGTLADWKSNPDNKFTSQLKKELQKKLDIMHKNGYYHRDIHDNNVLINNNKGKIEIFLGDFGLSDREDDIKNEASGFNKLELKKILTGKWSSRDELDINKLVVDTLIYKKKLKFKF